MRRKYDKPDVGPIEFFVHAKTLNRNKQVQMLQVCQGVTVKSGTEREVFEEADERAIRVLCGEDMILRQFGHVPGYNVNRHKPKGRVDINKLIAQLTGKVDPFVPFGELLSGNGKHDIHLEVTKDGHAVKSPKGLIRFKVR